MRRNYMMVGDLQIPCQASVRKDSAFYQEDIIDTWGPKVDIFIDGVKQGEVVSFDVGAGWVRVLKLGSDGKPFVEGEEVASEIKRGKVEIKLIEAAR